MSRGLADADLGGGLFKQRIARSGQGRSGGYRTLIAFRQGDRAVFIYGFAKNERDNINNRELIEMRLISHRFLSMNSGEIKAALTVKELEELKTSVSNGNETEI